MSNPVLKKWAQSLMAIAIVFTMSSIPVLAQSETDETKPVEVTGEIQQDIADEPDQESETSAEANVENASLDFMNLGGVPGSLEQLRAMEVHVAKLTEDLKPMTVNIRVGQAQGSGVVVTSDGYILTAAHVIGGPNKNAIVTFPDGKEVKARTLGVNRKYDSGMLKIKDSEGEDWPYADIGESASLNLGQWIVAIGHPGGLDKKRGLVLRVGRMIARREQYDESSTQAATIRTDCTLVGGDSGGPLFDMDGYLIGIHSRIGGKLTDNIHVPIDTFSREWDTLAGGKIIGGTIKPYLGFNVKDDSNEVTKVTENGPADKAGIEVGDIILEINGKQTENKADIRGVILKVKPDDKLKVLIKRKDDKKELMLIVGQQ